MLALMTVEPGVKDGVGLDVGLGCFVGVGGALVTVGAGAKDGVGVGVGSGRCVGALVLGALVDAQKKLMVYLIEQPISINTT